MEDLMKGIFNKAFTVALLISMVQVQASLPHFVVSADEIVAQAMKDGVKEAAENGAADAARAATKAGWLWSKGAWIVNGLQVPFVKAYELMKTYPKTSLAIGLGLVGAGSVYGVKSYNSPASQAARQAKRDAANAQAKETAAKALSDVLDAAKAAYDAKQTNIALSCNKAVLEVQAALRTKLTNATDAKKYVALNQAIANFDTAVSSNVSSVVQQTYNDLKAALLGMRSAAQKQQQAALKVTEPKKDAANTTDVKPGLFARMKSMFSKKADAGQTQQPVVTTTTAPKTEAKGFWTTGRKVAAGLGTTALLAIPAIKYFKK